MTTTDNQSALDKFNRPLRDLRISIIDKCNFRCPYCMPVEIFGADYNFLNKNELLQADEIVRLAQLFVNIGVTKLRITGGEPLVRPDVIPIVSQLAQIPGVDDLALTTNGFYLEKYAQQLKDAGLHRLTISFDSLDNDIYRKMNGAKAHAPHTMRALETAVSVGFDEIKLNCVVKKNINDHTIVDLARHFKGSGHIVRFIEYMDVGNLNGWKMDDVVTAAQITDLINAELPIEPVPPNYPGEVATRFRYLDGSGEIGIIASVTQPFCGSCTRARVSSAGEYYTCLFAHQGVDLRQPMRDGATDEEMINLITGVWTKRSDRYSELRNSFTRIPAKGAEMYRLGG
ncbi:MAG: GTP 3',8-cyclase MoaA [Chloroflexi bacterium]|nr:GTP 3',8-cyclase MoaA [Chloroflexota bacterium]